VVSDPFGGDCFLMLNWSSTEHEHEKKRLEKNVQFIYKFYSFLVWGIKQESGQTGFSGLWLGQKRNSAKGVIIEDFDYHGW